MIICPSSLPPSRLRRSLVLTALCIGLSAPALAATSTVDTVQGRRVESLVSGPATASPVVVFENGARMTLDTWSRVIEGLGPDVAALAHNRAGYGQSEPIDNPRTGEVIVEELRALLAAKMLKPPYVLVGHSLGGLYMQWFARRYPNEVHALVLVDALYPRIIKKPGAVRISVCEAVGNWLLADFSYCLQAPARPPEAPRLSHVLMVQPLIELRARPA